ncbi:pyridoxamine 5'-phosphate oxidase family protein [Streptomyces sp. NPDC046557]|uniref:helix-turn-helix domain-containing protein n=1 Tax=Streptomyces sp. NPDC046557 TaxID=3155372 RepID=UPI003403FD52
MGKTAADSYPNKVPAARGDLGRRVTARREELGITREELAERCGAAAPYIAYLEERASAPSMGMLVALADGLSTTVAELTGRTIDSPPGEGTAMRDAELTGLSEAECRRLLSTHGIGRVGFSGPEGPAVFPVNYVIVGSEIAFRTAAYSRLAEASGTEVAFEVDHIDDAMREGWSVLAVGELSEVTDEARISHLHAVARSLPWAGGPRTHWMSMTPTRITGRRVQSG